MHRLIDQAVAWVGTHPATSIIGAWWMFSNAVSAMPTPNGGDGKLYRWAFGFLHSIAGNMGRLVATKFPGVATSLGLSPSDPPKPPVVL